MIFLTGRILSAIPVLMMGDERGHEVRNRRRSSRA
jgi:hypothetical protein